jgi:predicted DNA-binding antitoxin AbrB/MazE fold protein
MEGVATMTRTIEAFYENGALHPLEPLEGVAEHSRVTLILNLDAGVRPHALADLIGTLSDEDAKEMRQAIDEEFEGIDAEKWK